MMLDAFSQTPAAKTSSAQREIHEFVHWTYHPTNKPKGTSCHRGHIGIKGSFPVVVPQA